MHNPLANADHVLVAFEGPLCAALPKAAMSTRLKPLLGEATLPEDPIAVLREAQTYGPATARVVHTQLKALEYEAVATAPLTAGAHQALSTLSSQGTVVTVTSSLSLEAVRHFLILHDLQGAVKQIAARTTPSTTHLPPNPHLLEEAIHHRGIPKESCLYIATTPADTEAADSATLRRFTSWVQLGIPTPPPVDNSPAIPH